MKRYKIKELEINPISEVPKRNVETLVMFSDAGMCGTVFFQDSESVRDNDSKWSFEWERTAKYGGYTGWLYQDDLKIEELELDEEDEEELTISDLIKAAKQNGYKWIAQDEDGEIFFYRNKPYRDLRYFRMRECNTINDLFFVEFKNRKSIKKWYEGDWTNSLIEVK